MKVFISWSGDRSLAIAKSLRSWLPRVIQAVEPWLSESDIGKGTRWEQEIGIELLQSKFGIICLTPENLDSRWVNFEALSKTIEKTYVCTYLLDLKPTDIDGPLSQFNHTKADKDDTRKLILTMNAALDAHVLQENIVNDAFDVWWPRLEEQLNHLPAVDEKLNPPRRSEDMIEEILTLVRSQAIERVQSSQVSDKLLFSLLQLFRLAAVKDSTIGSSTELLDSLTELEIEARRRGTASPVWQALTAGLHRTEKPFAVRDEAKPVGTGGFGKETSQPDSASLKELNSHLDDNP